MFEMVKVSKAIIGNDVEQCVDARELWVALESKQRFGNWITNRIETSKLIDGQDFGVNNKPIINPKGGRPEKDYILTLDIAKHFAMMENTSKGHEVRQYFIEVEKRARKVYQQANDFFLEEKAKRLLDVELSVASLFDVPKHIAQIEAVKTITNKTGIDFSSHLLNAPAQDNIKHTCILHLLHFTYSNFSPKILYSTSIKS